MATEQATITAAADDVGSDALGFQQDGFNNVLFIDDNDTGGGWFAVSLRFAALDLTDATTIDSAVLTLARFDDNNGANGVVRIRCEDSNHPATGSSGDRPYQRPHRAAFVDHTFPADGSTQQVDVTSLVQDLIDAGYTYEGNAADAILFTFGAANQWGLPAAVSWRAITADLTHATLAPATLDVTYSVQVADEEHSGSVEIAAAGTVAASGVKEGAGAATITGAATVAASATTVRDGSAAVAGTGGVQGAGATARTGSPTVEGEGSTTATATTVRAGGAGVQGEATISATATTARAGEALLVAIGGVEASVRTIRAGSVAVAGTGIVTATVRTGAPVQIHDDYVLRPADTRTAISVGESRLVASAPDGRTVGSAMDTRTVATAAATRTEVEV